MEEEVLDLSDKLKTITIWLDDAEERGWKDPSIKKWLKKLEDTAHEMEDILDEWNYFLLKHEKEYEQSTSTSVATSDATAMKIQNVKVKLDQILKEKNDFKFAIWENDYASSRVIKRRKVTLSPSSRVQSTSSIKFEKVYGEGINKNKKDVVRRLMVNGDSQILCIVGMGGLGKTTLAQLVYNTQVVMDWFDLRIWICVSDPFDVGGIARGIVQSVTDEIIPPTTNQLEILLRKLRDCISGKKFLLVLDDVWTEKNEEWGPLEINLKDGATGSKILVTTRKEMVAKMMGTLDDDICRPQPLSTEECWSLLRCLSLPGRSEEECREFEDVGKKIARKCDGLPLAANVLGSLLQFKPSLEEWEKVLESEIWQLEKEEDVEIYPHLVLSYNELSSTLKRCFSYIAIYPKDSIICDVKVIEEWMALGYLGSVVGNDRVELKGRNYFKNLAMRSLLRVFGGSSKLISYKMHDIVHDFAQFLRKNNAGEMKKRNCQVCDPCLVSEAQEYRSLFWDNKTPLVLCDCLTSLRVLRFISGGIAPPQRMEKLIHLRLLDLRDTKLSKEDLIIICSLYLLQTLLLAGCSLKEIPKEIKNLDGLRKLDLSRNALIKLPKSICNLLELKTLCLARCSLKEIGEEIETMVGLRELDLSFNRELKELPDSICGLLELQILDLTKCDNLNGLPERIHMLQNLQELLIVETPVWNCMPKGVGQLSGLRKLRFGDFWKIRVGSGRNKLGWLKNLNRLTGDLTLEIKLSSMSDLEELVEETREAQLKNKIHLESLWINFSGGCKEGSSSSASLWMNVIEALEPNQKLQYLRIWGYRGCRLPQWISSPFNLVKYFSLSFSEVSSLPHMGKLPLLESLYIQGLGELQVVGLEFLGIESSSTQDVVAFPKLKELIFSWCDKWEEWEDITVEEEESAAVCIMPCLTHLTIACSNNLKKLPHRLLLKASYFQFLDISLSRELEKSYRDKDGSAWRSISQYNPQLQLILSS